MHDFLHTYFDHFFFFQSLLFITFSGKCFGTGLRQFIIGVANSSNTADERVFVRWWKRRLAKWSPSLRTQVDQQQYPNSQIDQSPVKVDGSWDSNELSDCLSDNDSIQGQAVSDSQQPKRRRARRQWKQRGQQPAVCSQRGSTNIQPKIAPNLIKNPALAVSPTESDRLRIPVFPGLDVHKGENPSCVQRTFGWLPLGICDSGVEVDRYESIFDVYGIAASLERAGHNRA